MVAGVAGEETLLEDVSNGDCGDISRLYMEDYRRPVRRYYHTGHREENECGDTTKAVIRVY